MLPIFHSVIGAGTYGGNAFVEGILSGETTFEDPAFVESLQAVKDVQPFLPPDVTAVSYTDSQNLFVNELAAMFPGGSWEGAFFLDQNPELDLGVFAVPAKGTDEQMVSWFVDGAWAVTTSTRSTGRSSSSTGSVRLNSDNCSPTNCANLPYCWRHPDGSAFKRHREPLERSRNALHAASALSLRVAFRYYCHRRKHPKPLFRQHDPRRGGQRLASPDGHLVYP